MIRTFQTHKLRKTQELSGRLWSFVPVGEEQKSRMAAVPGCWENMPGFENFRGEAEYSTVFSAGGNVRLEFKGVSHTAQVFVDGKKAAEHYNAYTPFDVVLPNLKRGEHRLCVRADNRFTEASALHVPNDYMTYGGITRAVVLEEVPDVYIRWVHVTPDRAKQGFAAKIEVCLANVSGSEQEAEVKGQLAGKTLEFGNVSVRPGAEQRVQGEFSFPDAEEWSMENPRLYPVEIMLFQDGEATDDLIDRVGFRTVRIEENRLLINEKAVRIKGFCRHEDHPMFGCALPYEAMVYDLNLLKDLGANSVRTSHYPNDEIFLDLCDEMGILVWEENHARGLSEEMMRNPNFERQCEDVIREMITAHYNHPGIYIWGILNECASDTEYGRECYAKQYALIRELDASRPRSSASCRFKTDICFGYPEVVSYNIYPQWYHDGGVRETVDDLYQWVQRDTAGAGKPFLITEIGAGAIYGYRTATHDKWSEEYQAETLRKQITEVMAYEGCQGMYIWQFCDVRVSREWFDKRPKTMNNKGVVDDYRRRKLSYETVRELYRGYSDYLGK